MSIRAYNVGVTAGYLKYDMNFSFGQLNGGQSYNQSARITVNITVTDTMIVGTVEVSNITGSLPAGITSPISPGKQSFSIDTATWTAINSSTAVYIIPAGLNVGDSVPGDRTVQSVTDWNGRTALVINSSQDFGYLGTEEFDKQTGVILETSGSYNQGYTLITYSINLTDTTLFSITPTFLGLAWWIWVIAIVIIVGAILGAIVLILRRKPPNVQTPDTPAPPVPT